MNYFDLHCDTLLALYGSQSKLDSNSHHISLQRTEEALGHYAQFFAFYTPRKMSDAEGFELYLKAYSNFSDELKRLDSKILPCRSFDDLTRAEKENKAAAFHAIEDVRLINGDINKLDLLYEMGVRYVTLVWGGTSNIGGAHDTDMGLTEFGKQVARRAFKLGIVPDISHSSEKTVDDLIPIAEEMKKPFIATHSNSYTVYPHSRNLRDRHFKKLKELGGIVGISLCDSHIQDESCGRPDINGIMRHVEHYLSLGGENNIAIGADLDGTSLPDGFSSVSDIPQIAEHMAKLGYSDELINKIFYNNARAFIKRNLKK